MTAPHKGDAIGAPPVALCALALVLLACIAEARSGPDEEVGQSWGANAEYAARLSSMAGVVFGDDAVKVARSRETAMRLHLMSDKGLGGMGAVCLDGSDAGFYFAPAASLSDSKNWQIYFEGGAWCFGEMDCWNRSTTDLGSSTQWQKWVAVGGIMSGDCTVNPDFCNFNRVFLRYCDGFSFAGDRTEPLVVQGADSRRKPIYFRGKRILDAALQTLAGMGLFEAEQVLLTGCSAGGLAAFLHADYVHGVLQEAGVPLKVYKVAPLSGIFPMHNSFEGVPVYADEMKAAFRLSNASGGMNARCLAAFDEEDRWKCSFALHSYVHTLAPLFPLNSALDQWSTCCVLSGISPPGFPNRTHTNGRVDATLCAKVPGWYECSWNLTACTASQVVELNDFMNDFTGALRSTRDAWQKDGNGAFIHSCHTHCEAQDTRLWTAVTIGGVSMQQAVSSWWKNEKEPAVVHSYTDCALRPENPHMCNPTCAGAPGVLQQVI